MCPKKTLNTQPASYNTTFTTNDNNNNNNNNNNSNNDNNYKNYNDNNNDNSNNDNNNNAQATSDRGEFELGQLLEAARRRSVHPLHGLLYDPGKLAGTLYTVHVADRVAKIVTVIPAPWVSI